jgi:DNA-binding PadR family transcriptional regulator
MSSKEIDEIVSDFSRFYIFTILYEGPSHGYSILSKFKKRIGKEISPSLVYPFLKQLEQKGLVKHSLKPVGAKKKKVFELTKEGKELSKQLFKRFSALVSVAIEPSLEVCANCGCKVYEGGYREVINRKEMTFCCVHCAASYKHEARNAGKKTK